MVDVCTPANACLLLRQQAADCVDQDLQETLGIMTMENVLV